MVSSRSSQETRPSFDASQFEIVSPKAWTLTYPFDHQWDIQIDGIHWISVQFYRRHYKAVISSNYHFIFFWYYLASIQFWISSVLSTAFIFGSWSKYSFFCILFHISIRYTWGVL
jgi:hypothetical protein